LIKLKQTNREPAGSRFVCFRLFYDTQPVRLNAQNMATIAYRKILLTTHSLLDENNKNHCGQKPEKQHLKPQKKNDVQTC